MIDQSHHRGDYHRRAFLVRQRAYRNPSTRCWRCGKTLTEVRRHKTGRAPYWTAGHVIDAEVTSPLLPECSVCNFSHGARFGNNLRARRNGNTQSRRWFA